MPAEADASDANPFAHAASSGKGSGTARGLGAETPPRAKAQSPSPPYMLPTKVYPKLKINIADAINEVDQAGQQQDLGAFVQSVVKAMKDIQNSLSSCVTISDQHATACEVRHLSLRNASTGHSQLRQRVAILEQNSGPLQNAKEVT